MGIVHPGVPQPLAKFLQAALGLDVFIETGTQYGYTARWAASHFSQAHSIELSPALWARAVEALGDVGNLTLHQGASPAVLARLLPTLPGPALLWLDAHWSLGETAGEDDPCPLLAELEAVLTQPVQHTILIDDARLFCAPPALPHPAAAWPSLAKLTHALRALGREEFFLFEDVIIVPAVGDVELLRKYLQMRDTLTSQSPLRQPLPLPEDLAARIAAAQGPALLALWSEAARLVPAQVRHHVQVARLAFAQGDRAAAREAAEWAMAVDLEVALAEDVVALRGSCGGEVV